MLQIADKPNAIQKGLEHALKFQLENLAPDFVRMIQDIAGKSRILHVAVDCRMVNTTGIGMCLKGWLPYLLSRYGNWHYTLFGNPAELAAFPWAHAEHIRIRPFTSPIYSLHEQWAWLCTSPEEFDLLWVPHLNIPYFWKGKMLVTVHDVIFPAMPEIFSPAKRLAAQTYFRRIRARAAHIMFVSQFTRNEFHKFIGKPLGQETVVYNTIGNRWFEAPAPAPLPDRIAGKPYIACIGNVKPHKNLRRLIAAFKLIMNTIPHNLVIIGKREGFITGDKTLNALAASTGERIIFTGYIDDTTLQNLVAQASLLVQPSLYEGFGITPLEAMASGCPVAISRIQPFLEICGNHASYFNPLDAGDMASVIRGCLNL